MFDRYRTRFHDKNCKYLLESTTFEDNGGHTFMIQVNINCKRVGVIYCIFCTKCNRNIYVGQKNVDKYLTKRNIYVWSFSHPISWQKFAKKTARDFHRAVSKIFDRVNSVALWFTFPSVDMEILAPFSILYTLRLRLRVYLATSGC
jgi:hypothetical protein